MDFVFECLKCSRRKKEQHPSLMEAARSLPFCDFDRTRMRQVAPGEIRLPGVLKRPPASHHHPTLRERRLQTREPSQGRQEALL